MVECTYIKSCTFIKCNKSVITLVCQIQDSCISEEFVGIQPWIGNSNRLVRDRPKLLFTVSPSSRLALAAEFRAM